MTRLMIGLLVAAGLTVGFATSARAAYVGSPVNVPLDVMEERRLVIAGEGNFVSRRDLNPVAGTRNKIDESTQIGLRAEYGLAEGVSMFLKAGLADWTFTSATLTVQYDSTPYVGGGLKYLYQSDANLLLGGDIQYLFQSRTKAESVTDAGVAATTMTGLDAEVTDLQISILLGYRVALHEDTSLIPYVGIAYSQFDFSQDRGTFTTTGVVSRPAQGYDGDNAVGIIVGASLQTGPSININVETRFIAEHAFSIGVNYRF